MKGLKDFRRSLNKDRTSGGRPRAAPPSTFTGVQNAVTIQPPKKVIRATRDYRSRAPQELSFHKGDFFHVLSDDSGNPDWLEATNPATNARGLVPAAYFDVLTKSRPTIAGPAGSSPTLPTPPGAMGMAAAGGSGATSPAAQTAASRVAGATINAKGGGGLYAVVKYDFVAERADELGAKAGESIIVIAQSNFEWFVAKPIGRLGGPGLIPVAFVEIKDLTTGQAIDNVQELIESGVVPKVEEWKKMTADYKKNTIPLGRFDFPQGGAAAAAAGLNGTDPSALAMGSSSFAAGQGIAPEKPAPPPKEDGGFGAGADDGTGLEGGAGELPPGMPPGEPLPAGIITTATVDSFHYEQGDYWFRIQAAHIAGVVSSVPVPPSVPVTTPGEARDLILYRLYEDFYEFQIALLDHFPSEAGRETDANGQPSKRILPLMPGPLEQVDDLITSQRRIDLDAYINELCALPDYILRSELVRLFFEPRPGDHCTTHAAPAGSGAGQRPGQHKAANSAEALGQEYGYLSGGIDQVEGGQEAYAAQDNGVSKYAEDMPVGSGHAPDDLASRVARLSVERGYGSNGHGSQSEHRSSATGGYLRPQDSVRRAAGPTTEARDSRGSSSAGRQSGSAAQQQAQTSQQQSPAFIKIKIYNRANDDLVAIRVPPSVSYAALLDKVRERLGQDLCVLRYKEAVPEPGSSGLMRISDDDDLAEWLDSGAKMSLFADVK